MDGGRTVASYLKDQKVYSQGDPADALFYIQKGQVKVCVTSDQGKEAVVALHREGDFFGGGLPEPPTTALGDSARRFPGMGNFPRNRTAGSRHDQPQESKGIIADGLISSACSRIERTSQARAEPRPAALALNSFDP